MENSERPFSLMLVVAIYFLTGFMACLAFLTDKPTDFLSISTIFIAYGLIRKASWALIGLKVVVVFQLLIVAMMILFMLLPGDSSGEAYVGLGAMRWDISPTLFKLMFFSFVGFQTYVAFSKETQSFIERN